MKPSSVFVTRALLLFVSVATVNPAAEAGIVEVVAREWGPLIPIGIDASVTASPYLAPQVATLRRCATECIWQRAVSCVGVDLSALAHGRSTCAQIGFVCSY